MFVYFFTQFIWRIHEKLLPLRQNYTNEVFNLLSKKKGIRK